MTVELIFDPDEDGEGFDLCPNHAWRKLARWVDPERFPGLDSLASGEHVPIGAIKAELPGATTAAAKALEVTAVLDRLNELTADARDDAILKVE